MNDKEEYQISIAQNFLDTNERSVVYLNNTILSSTKESHQTKTKINRVHCEDDIVTPAVKEGEQKLLRTVGELHKYYTREPQV